LKKHIINHLAIQQAFNIKLAFVKFLSHLFYFNLTNKPPALMKRHFILSFFLLIAIYASAQKAGLKGVINDTASNEKLVNATIALLNAKDSTLWNFSKSAAGLPAPTQP
jgi:hypothetical protein